MTVADLAKLRWIEGSWRGTGGGVPTFYERYKFENDSTLLVETLTDETLSKVSDEGRFELKDGHFGKSDGESGSVAPPSTTIQLLSRRSGRRETLSAFNANRTTPGKPFSVGLTRTEPRRSASTSWNACPPENQSHKWRLAQRVLRAAGKPAPS